MANVTKYQKEIWKQEVYEIYKTGITIDEYIREYLNLNTEEKFKLEHMISLKMEGGK